MSAFINLSNNKIGDHNGDTTCFGFCYPFSFSLPIFILIQSLILWGIHTDSLDLKFLLDSFPFFQFSFVYSHFCTVALM
jgi:hypothetical protein